MSDSAVKHLITWKDWEPEEVQKILQLATSVKVNL